MNTDIIAILREHNRSGRPIHILTKEKYTERELLGDVLDELEAYRAAIPDLERAQELGEADKAGRAVVLPPFEDENYDGLKAKYRVYKARNGEPVEGCFILRPEKDVAARGAIIAYAANSGNYQLLCDALDWIGSIVESEAREAADKSRT